MKRSKLESKIEAQAKLMAERLFEGNALSAEFLRWHMYFRGEARVTASPYVVDGIRFFLVGKNASHSFFAGMRDGQLYRCALGDEVEEDAQGNEVLDADGFPVVTCKPSVTAVEDMSGYWGHH
jgi:hypothetical protein